MIKKYDKCNDKEIGWEQNVRNVVKFAAKSKDPMQLKTFYLQADVSKVNFFLCQSKIHFFKKQRLNP